MDFTELAFTLFFLAWCATVAVSCGAIRTLWLRVLRDAAVHNEELQKVHDFYKTALTHIGTTAQTGRPEIPAAVVTFEDDAELRVRAAIADDTIRRGMAEMRAAYQAARMPVPDDTALRAEVESLLAGESPAAFAR